MAVSTRIEKFRKYRSDIAKMDDGGLNTPISKTQPSSSTLKNETFSSSITAKQTGESLKLNEFNKGPNALFSQSNEESKIFEWWPFVKTLLATLLVIGLILSVVFWIMGEGI